MALELRILGPVQVVRAGRDVPLGGPKQRAVLALLLVDAGRVVSAGQLAEALWQGSPPAGAAKTLRSYVSRLRAVLAPEVAVVARGGGYALTAEPDLVDAARFERLVGAGQGALAMGEVASAAGRFCEALALWRGAALADVSDVEPLALEAARLEELRLVAVEGRAEASIALGQHGEVVGELERLVAEYPVRERLWRLLVLALYRAERQADALAAYRRARAMLAEELGLEPGGDLRELAQAVLRQQVPAAPRPERHGLPAPLTSLVGREEELAVLDPLVGRARLVTLTGPGGVGKTRLAAELAAAVLDRFPDGVWLADLAGITDAQLVASRLMETLGVRQSGDLPVIEALRHRLRAAELLLMLDNCEHLLDACARLAGELLGSCPGLRVLATSREPLGVAGEAVFVVPPLAVPAEPDDDASTAASPAVRLFTDRAAALAGTGSVTAGTVGRICRALDGLPLAIELAAARTGTLSVAEIEQHLADKFRFLVYRRPVANARHQALKTAIGWSYELLAEPERSFFRALSVFAGGFRLAEAAEVCCAADQAAALDLVDALVGKSLVVAERSGAGTRYRLLETIREYAAGQLGEAGEAGRAGLRHAAVYLGLAERERDLGVLSGEHDNFRAALEWSLARAGETGPRLAAALGGFWLACGLYQEGQSWLERAAAAVPSAGPLRADLSRLLGTVLFEAGELDQAEAVLAQGSEAAAAARLPALQARIRIQLTEVHARQGGPEEETLAECEAATAILDAEGDLEGLAEAWRLTGMARFWLGESPADQEACERAMSYARQCGHPRVEIQAGRQLVGTLRLLPIPADAAIARAEQLLQIADGEPWAEADILDPLSVIYAYAGRFAEAREAIARAQSVYGRPAAKITWALGAFRAGEIELIAGDPSAAERHLREAYEAYRAMGERGFLSSVAGWLAEALYAQGRLDEAQQMTEEGQAAASPADIDAQARWRAARAKVLARNGQFPAARTLLDEAEALVSPTSWAMLQAEILMARAEVDRLAGAPEQAEASLRTALRISQDRHATPLADQAAAALASLGAQPG